MRILGRIFLMAVTAFLMFQAGRLIMATFKRTETPTRIMQEAGIYLVVMIVVSRVYRKL